MTKDELRKVQLCQLDLALEVKRICEKHKLKFSLTYGTLLGAVRHGGFIPWDDDLDICMPRNDYERFLHICSYELDSEYILCTYSTNKKYGGFSAQIRIKNTMYCQEICNKANVHKGIFIDVCALDFCSNNKYVRLIEYNHFKLYKISMLLKQNYEVKKFPVLACVLKMGCHFVSSEFIMKKMIQIAKKRNNTNYLWGFSCGYKPYEGIPASCFEHLISMSFEGYDFPIFSEYDKILSQWYGNYMVLPPVECRENRHEIIQLDFGSYQIRSCSNENMKYKQEGKT